MNQVAVLQQIVGDTLEIEAKNAASEKDFLIEELAFPEIREQANAMSCD